MGQLVRAALPIAVVLERGEGALPFTDLADLLVKHDARRFPDERTVSYAIGDLIACLKIDGEVVRYDREARNYTRHPEIWERLVQQFLHQVVPRMGEFQLYPFRDRTNSSSCYIGVPWGRIPPNLDAGVENLPLDCDYWFNGVNRCMGACGVDASTHLQALFIHLAKDTPD